MKSTALFALLFLVSGTSAAVAESTHDGPCGLEAACSVGERVYRAKAPENWDGKEALPVLIHFHGWKRDSKHPLKNPKALNAINGNGALLVAPEGLHRTWDFWERDNRDVPFVRAVLEDVAKRYPIDRSRIYATGFSYGSAMAWRVACDAGDLIAGILPAAGTLYRQNAITCPTGPVNVMHVHGFKDNVMKMPLGPDGDPNVAVNLWRRTNLCAGEPDTSEIVNGHDCRTWSSCQSGKEVMLCVHDRGHIVPKGWIDNALSIALQRYRLAPGAHGSKSVEPESSTALAN
ncbi:PHB depolymerase family esterase [Roseibium sp. MMSF_3412]|uniref:alpha/beta hydrolase family esterase n=1 Tax=Roseibium sp. MMSF_3412 TaxID=3046712 RepID=UPI00273F2BE6|nr:polyhydroxybutyrate depolymerase [Roseibium sp. MMSF_3412]